MKILAMTIIKTFAYDDELVIAMMKMLAVADSLKHMTVELVHASFEYIWNCGFPVPYCISSACSEYTVHI